MEFADVVRRRRMVRRYDPERAVTRAQLEQLLSFAVRAPSAGFSQGWEFLVLHEPSDVAKYWHATTAPDPGQPERRPDSWLLGMRTAPALILPFCDKNAYIERYAAPDKGWTDRDEARWTAPYWYVDTGMASLLVLLGAVDAGLAACFFGVPPERLPAVRRTFGIPSRLASVGAISIGYAAPDRPSPSVKRGRRTVDDVAHFGRFSTPG